ncbi:MAG: molecular chaperone DnaJ [Pseudomonadota bacterium]
MPRGSIPGHTGDNLASTDYYETLGVAREASEAEIKVAYRRLALRYHPDRNPGDRGAEDRFKELSTAYAVLSDADKKAHYDRFGFLGDSNPFAAANVATATDFFDAIFGDLLGLGRRRASVGRDLRYTLEIEFEEAALGCRKTIGFDRSEDCAACRGTGAEGGAAGLAKCGRCGGRGSQQLKPGLLGGRRECAVCGGTGEIPRVRCRVCEGAGLVDRWREFDVAIPARATSGSVERVPGQGSPGRRGGASGDLHVIVRVKPHPFYAREGEILIVELPVSITEAALGAEVDVPVLDGSVRMKIPAGTQSGSVFRMRGKGIPRAAGGRGDCHVRVVIETPVGLAAEGQEILMRLEGALGSNATPLRRAFRAKLAAAEIVRVAATGPADEGPGSGPSSGGGPDAGSRATATAGAADARTVTSDTHPERDRP